jgi:hypothetical protein
MEIESKIFCAGKNQQRFKQPTDWLELEFLSTSYISSTEYLKPP